jgi:hypothetical protein
VPVVIRCVSVRGPGALIFPDFFLQNRNWRKGTTKLKFVQIWSRNLGGVPRTWPSAAGFWQPCGIPSRRDKLEQSPEPWRGWWSSGGIGIPSRSTDEEGRREPGSLLRYETLTTFIYSIALNNDGAGSILQR